MRRPLASMTFAPAGTGVSGPPPAAVLPSRVTSVPLSMGAPPRGGIVGPLGGGAPGPRGAGLRAGGGGGRAFRGGPPRQGVNRGALEGGDLGGGRERRRE